MQKEIERIRVRVLEAEMVLVGFGEEFALKAHEREAEKAYGKVAELVRDKNYFVITTCQDERLYHAGFRKDRIVRPLAPEEAENLPEGEEACGHSPMWGVYMKWLQGTINRRLLLLELGVGLRYPDVIRFPFEKMTYYNLKAELIRVHEKLYQLPAELNGRGISVKQNAVRLWMDEVS